MKKPIMTAGIIILCIGVALNLFMFMITLPGGPGTQQQIDWLAVLTSFAPAYLPWKIIVAIYIVGFFLTILGFITKRKEVEPTKRHAE